MSVAAKLRSPVKAAVERRAILGPTGNRFRVSQEVRRKAEVVKKQERRMKSAPEVPDSAVRNNVSVDSSESTDSSSSSSGHSSVKTAPPRRSPAKHNSAKKTAKVVRDGVVDSSPAITVPVKRCDWITANSGQLVRPPPF